MPIVLKLLLLALFIVFVCVVVGKAITFGLGERSWSKKIDEQPWPSGPFPPEHKHPKKVA